MSKTTVTWDGEKVMKQFKAELGQVTRESADLIARTARQGLMSNGSIDSGETIGAIKIKRSKFKDGGYIVGVFGKESGKWVDSLGGRAVFIEYGHAAPGKGRGGKVLGGLLTRKKSEVSKSVESKPFFRPAVDAGKKQFKRAVKQALKV